MPKVADVRILWKKSVSTDVSRQKLNLTIDGQATNVDLGPEVQEYLLTVKAGGVVHFDITTFDKDGLQSVSLGFDFTLSDLEPPQPATDLGFEITGVRDVPSE